MYESILRRDYPVLMGTLLMATVLVIVANLIVDVIYLWLDPRVAYHRQ
jgi:ABC-type dipeptide/oligopeptide/nickel transport system permease component